MLRSAFATPFSMLTLLVALLAGPVTSTLAADSSLVYSPVPPCRIFDTRNTGGPIAAGTSEDFYVYGDAATIGGQGGNPAGCPAPQGEPIAVHMNITVVPLGDGHIRVYPKGTALPNASTVNYMSGTNIANAVTLKTTFDPADLDISVYSSNTANVLADVQGYYYPKLKNVITVSAQYADFTNPIDAINSIPTTGPNAPSATNPYVIEIGPGIYDLGSNQLVMREWVNIKGTGGGEATVITGAVSTGSLATSAMVVGASNAELTDLTIINTGGNNESVAIYNDGASPRIESITATATGGTNVNYGLYNTNNAAPVLNNVTLTVSGGNSNFGIGNYNSDPVLNNVTVTASGGSGPSTGVRNYLGSSSVLNNVTVTASGGNHARAIDNYQSSITMTNVNASALGGSYDSVGYWDFESAATIQYSTLRSDQYSMNVDEYSGVRVTFSTLISPSGLAGSSSPFCMYVTNNSIALGNHCEVPSP
jgi:hypothetical protein